MYDTVEQCDERLAEIEITMKEVSKTTRRLQLEIEYIYSLKKLIEELGPSEQSPAIKNLLSSVKESDARKDGVDETPNDKFLRIIREHPGISRDELATLSQINGRQLDNKLGHFRGRKMIENRGTSRPGGARWYATK